MSPVWEAKSHSSLACSDGLCDAPSPVSFPCFSTGPSQIQGGVELGLGAQDLEYLGLSLRNVVTYEDPGGGKEVVVILSRF